MAARPTPEQLTVWRLFLTVHARLVNAIDQQLDAARQIPLHWYDVLIELYEAPNQRLRLHELAEKVVLSRSGLTRLLDRLVTAGYIQRETDATDRRGAYAIITASGIQALRDAWPVYAEGIVSGFAQYLDEASLQAMVTVFNRILNENTTTP